MAIAPAGRRRSLTRHSQPWRFCALAGLLFLAVFSGCKMIAGPPPGAQNWPFSIGPRTYAVALGDLDGDGDLDAFLTNGENEVPVPDTVWLNDGQGRFSDSGQRIEMYESHHALLVDLDLDGDLDAIAAGTGGLQIYRNDGAGLLQPHGGIFGTSRDGNYVLAPAAADLNGDGFPDVIAGGCCGSVGMFDDGRRTVEPPVDLLWLSDGQGGFVESGQSFDLYGTVAVALGDLDGDGHLDAFFGNSASNVDQTETYVRNQPDTIWFNDGQGRFRPGDQQLGNAEASSAALGDLDGDGDLDILVGNNLQADEVWLNAGGAQGGEPGTFVQGETLSGEDYTRSVELADLDGDGDLDALIVYRETATVWLNDGAAGFSRGQSLAFEEQHALALGDLNGDGHIDIFAGSVYQEVLVWLNDGTGRFTR